MKNTNLTGHGFKALWCNYIVKWSQLKKGVQTRNWGMTVKHLEDIDKVSFSVTRKADYLLSIWTLTTLKIGFFGKKIARAG